MRQRTKSVVNVREYFRLDGTGAPEQDEDDEADDWMALATKCGVDDVGKKATARTRSSTCDSLAETDDDTDDDEENDGILRIRACSHGRRISFDDDVNVVEIPARSTFDADYKHRVWYSRDELRRSQECC